MVKIGAKYCTVDATAIGMCCIDWKKIVNAIIPLNPRMVNHFLLFPKKGKPRLTMIVELIEKEMIERAKTNSWAGIFCKPGITWLDGPIPKSFTKKFTIKNDTPERMI